MRLNGPAAQLVGNLAKDPELRYTQAGKAMCKLRIASTKKAAKDSNREDKTEWFDVLCFGRLAENVAESLIKGNRVFVAGNFESDQWGENNEKTSLVILADIVAPTLDFQTVAVTKNPHGGGGGGGGAPAQQPAMAGAGYGAPGGYGGGGGADPFAPGGDDPFAPQPHSDLESPF